MCQVAGNGSISSGYRKGAPKGTLFNKTWHPLNNSNPLPLDTEDSCIKAVSCIYSSTLNLTEKQQNSFSFQSASVRQLYQLSASIIINKFLSKRRGMQSTKKPGKIKHLQPSFISIFHPWASGFQFYQGVDNINRDGQQCETLVQKSSIPFNAFNNKHFAKVALEFNVIRNELTKTSCQNLWRRDRPWWQVGDLNVRNLE